MPHPGFLLGPAENAHAIPKTSKVCSIKYQLYFMSQMENIMHFINTLIYSKQTIKEFRDVNDPILQYLFGG